MGQYFTNDNSIPSKLVKTRAVVLNNSFIFYTDNGVFSKDGLDFGSRLLLENIPLTEIGESLLDVGCGYGVFGIVLNKILGVKVTMCDVNRRALHLAEKNIKENKCSDCSVIESNCYQNINSKYSTIITNPPIRAGKKVVYEILEGAKDYLLPDGRLFFVVRKEQGAKSIISDMQKIYNVEVLERKKGFFIIKCTF
ncbi:MAG: class I SAM-dependent methyltransferase [Clostridium sp.]|jgi:ribosomal protein L11 methyltransferase (prmA)|nr:class I SAM-dependent methyltransferase [Clostridium sp.]